MSETYFHELNLPDVPVADIESLRNSYLDSFGYSICKEPEKVLSTEILTKFSSIGVTPGYLVMFTNTTNGEFESRYLHKDRITKQDPRKITSLAGAEWVPANFGINFEVYPNDNTFYWVLEKDLVAKNRGVSLDPSQLFRAYLGGTHYDNPNNVYPAATKVVGSKPVLIRTDVPHKTTFEIAPDYVRRLGVSIRFYENWSWDEAKNIFKPLFI